MGFVDIIELCSKIIASAGTIGWGFYNGYKWSKPKLVTGWHYIRLFYIVFFTNISLREFLHYIYDNSGPPVQFEFDGIYIRDKWTLKENLQTNKNKWKFVWYNFRGSQTLKIYEDYLK